MPEVTDDALDAWWREQRHELRIEYHKDHNGRALRGEPEYEAWLLAQFQVDRATDSASVERTP